MHLSDHSCDSVPTTDAAHISSTVSDVLSAKPHVEDAKDIVKNEPEPDGKAGSTEKVSEETVEPGKGLEFPVVFLHAFADIPGWSGTWKAVEDVLKKRRIEYFSVQMPMGGSIEARSNIAIEQIAAKYPNSPVHLFGHCLGGFNARDIANRSAKSDLGFTVKTVTTFSTPHHGNKVLDLVSDDTANSAIATITKSFGYEFGEVLSERYVEEQFNPQTPDNPNVKYFSWTGDTILPTALTAAPWVATRPFGPTDGLVNVESAKWGTHLGTVMGLDHFSIIGRVTVEWSIPHLKAAEDGTTAAVLPMDQTYTGALVNRGEGMLNFALGLPRALFGF